MKYLHLTLPIIFAALVAPTTPQILKPTVKPNGATPVVLGAQPSTAYRGQQVLFTTVFDHPTEQADTVTVTSVSGDWSSIPASVNVGLEASGCQFYGTVSPSTSSSTTTVWVSLNGVAKSTTITILP